jgi:AraC-like DNA-binding protein
MAERASAHLPAVERVLALMRSRLGEPLALEDLAAEVYLSPFHFSRVFRQVTGAPPGEFLGALRLDAARRLILTTPLSVTEVCYEVGYASLGSFTSRFTQHVGVPPAALRRLAAEFEPARLDAVGRAAPWPSRASGATVAGRLHGALSPKSTLCIGLFPRPIPQGLPVACTQLQGAGPFRIERVPDGLYYLMAAALPWSDDPLAYLAPGRGLLVASHHAPLAVRGGSAAGPIDLFLRPPAATDPPIVAALPLLLARWARIAEPVQVPIRIVGEGPGEGLALT